jgi:hypothetical protein
MSVLIICRRHCWNEVRLFSPTGNNLFVIFGLFALVVELTMALIRSFGAEVGNSCASDEIDSISSGGKRHLPLARAFADGNSKFAAVKISYFTFYNTSVLEANRIGKSQHRQRKKSEESEKTKRKKLDLRNIYPPRNDYFRNFSRNALLKRRRAEDVVHRNSNGKAVKSNELMLKTASRVANFGVFALFLEIIHKFLQVVNQIKRFRVLKRKQFR